MKKAIVFAASVLAAAGAGLMLAGGGAPEVTLVSMKELEYTETFLVSGTVESTAQRELTPDFPLVPGEVLAKEGDVVSYGDPIATVDKEATVRAVAAFAEEYAGSLPDAAADRAAEAFAAVGEELAGGLDFLPDTICAPMSGVLTSVSLTEGTLYLPTAPAATVSSAAALQLRLPVPEDRVGLLRQGDAFSFTAAAVEGGLFSAQITRFSPSAYQKLNGISYETVVDVVARIEDDFNALRPGYTVQAELTAGEPENLWLLPYEAVMQDADGQDYVYVYREGEAVRRNVETGRELSTSVQIVSGVGRYEKVVQDAAALEGEGPVSVKAGED